MQRRKMLAFLGAEMVLMLNGLFPAISCCLDLIAARPIR